jgi:hypothetical protein
MQDDNGGIRKHHFKVRNCNCSFMEHSPFEKLILSLANKEISRLLWDEMVHYRVDKSPPPFPALSHVNSHNSSHRIFISSVLILYSHLRVTFRAVFILVYFNRTFVHTYHVPMHATCYFNFIFLDPIMLIMFREELIYGGAHFEISFALI